ncbi:MAG: hypothetical protein ACOY6E_02785 [Pseudomonadota bacterium]|jgi:hypothetical protein
MSDPSARGARKPSRWLLAALVAFVVGVYLITIMAHMRGTSGG